MQNKNAFICIDVGGTYIKSGIVIDGTIKEKHIDKSPCNLDDFISFIHKTYQDYSKNLNIISVGLGIPGIFNHKENIMKYATPSLSYLNEVPIKKELEKILLIPVFITNDANIVTIGEMKFGIGTKLDSAVCLTLGTGIGGGIYYKGKILIGDKGFACEPGHINVKDNDRICSCGIRKGCIENYFSISSITGDVEKIKGKHYSMLDILHLAKDNDIDIINLLENSAYLLGKAVASILLTLDIETIILAGGLSRFYDFIIQDIRKGISDYAYTADYTEIDILKSSLLEDAGILGAYLLAKTEGKILF
jgi:glucokinase